jgi:hypothetical protein
MDTTLEIPSWEENGQKKGRQKRKYNFLKQQDMPRNQRIFKEASFRY